MACVLRLLGLLSGAGAGLFELAAGLGLGATCGISVFLSVLSVCAVLQICCQRCIGVW